MGEAEEFLDNPANMEEAIKSGYFGVLMPQKKWEIGSKEPMSVRQALAGGHDNPDAIGAAYMALACEVTRLVGLLERTQKQANDAMLAWTEHHLKYSTRDHLKECLLAPVDFERIPKYER